MPSSEANRPSVRITRVGGAVPFTGARVAPDRMCRSLLAAHLHSIPHPLQRRNDVRHQAFVLHRKNVGQPLMVEPRRGDGPLDPHVEIDLVENYLQYRIDDGTSTRTAHNADKISVPGD